MLGPKTAQSADTLSPLSDKAHIAAAESYDYAIEHGLVLGLLTEEHLEYHHRFAAEEDARIPHSERLLHENHLPRLQIPPVSINEAWTVHQRVASVLEAACRWLSEDELRSYEAAVVEQQSAKERSRDDKSLKLECPILVSDPTEDFAELRRTVDDYADRAGTRLKNQQESIEIESALFDIPAMARAYKDRIDTEIQGGTIIVHEQTILWLMAHLDSIEWKQDSMADVLEKPPTRATRHRRLSSPLPPVLSIDEYVPEGDVCCVSDASDLSSSISDYVTSSANAIPRDSTEEYIEAMYESENCFFEAEAPTNTVTSQIDEISLLVFPMRTVEEDMLTCPSLLHQENKEPLPKMPINGELICKDYIEESVYTPSLEEEQREGKIALHNGTVTPGSQSSSLEDGFETVTADTLLALEEDETVKQAKIPVPSLSTESHQPEWSDAAADPMTLLRWMMDSNKEASCVEEWLPPRPSQFDDEFSRVAARMDEIHDEEWDADIEAMEKLTSQMKRGQTHDAAVLSSFLSELNAVKTISKTREEALEPWDFSHKDTSPETKTIKLKQQVVSTKRTQQPPQKPAETDTQHPPSLEASEKDQQSSWGSLMSRFKRRQNEAGGSSQKDDHNAQSQAGTATSAITAPELLIGARAFADAHPPADMRANNGNQSHASCIKPTPAGLEVNENLSDIDISVVAANTLPKVILSTAVPRVIRSRTLRLLPGLRFIERDYTQHMETPCDIDTDDEADIVVSPSSGIVLTTMISLRQMDSQRRPLLQSRLAKVAAKYETLYVVVYRSNAMPSPCSDTTPELSPSDAMAFAQLLGFTKKLACDVRVSYVSGGEAGAAESTAKLIGREEADNSRALEAHLTEEATKGEQFLRQAGLNVYDAQIVLGVMARDSATEADPFRAFVDMPPEERGRLFGGVVGSRRALEGVSRLLAVNIK